MSGGAPAIPDDLSGNKRERDTDRGVTVENDLKRLQPGSGPQAPAVVPVSTLLAGLAGATGTFNDGALAGVSIQAADASTDVTDYFPCPSDKVGKVIGKGGASIKDLMARSGCSIRVDLNVQGETKQVVIVGNRENVGKAKEMVADIITTETPAATREGEVLRTLEIATAAVGRIIGRGGETIKNLQGASGVRIAVRGKEDGSENQRVEITGKEDLVERAYKMVEELSVVEEPTAAMNAAVQRIIDKHCGSITSTMECPNDIVGRVIGRGGETIKGIQRHFGARVQIDRPDDGGAKSKITITGPLNAIDGVERALKDIIAGNDPERGPPGGGYPPPYGGPSPYPPYGGPPPPYGGPPPHHYAPPGPYHDPYAPPPYGHYPPPGHYHRGGPPPYSAPPAPPAGSAPYNPASAGYSAPPGAGSYSAPPSSAAPHSAPPSSAAPYSAPTAGSGYPGAPGSEPYSAAPSSASAYSAPPTSGYPAYQPASAAGTAPAAAPAAASGPRTTPPSYSVGPASTSQPGSYQAPDSYGSQQQPSQTSYSDAQQASGYSMYGGPSGGVQAHQGYGASQQTSSAPQSQPSYYATSGAAPSSPWMELRDNEGRVYYYNPTTAVSQWDKPADMP